MTCLVIFYQSVLHKNYYFKSDLLISNFPVSPLAAFSKRNFVIILNSNNIDELNSNFNLDLENASKVVDENGEPLVVYHGTTYSKFNSFKESGVSDTVSNNLKSGALKPSGIRNVSVAAILFNYRINELVNLRILIYTLLSFIDLCKDFIFWS